MDACTVSRASEDGGDSLFKNANKARRLFSTVRKISEGKLKFPERHAVNAGLNVTEELPEKTPGKSVLSKLYRKWRLESKRPRTVEEVYPDEAAEQQRKRLVRKTVTHILNLAAQKQHQSELQRIAELERTPLPAPSGLKSLGWKGDARFKNPDGPLSKSASSASTAAAAKPTQKRTPKEEAIKIFGELLRDKEWVRKVEAKMRSKKSDWKDLRRLETRHARKFERAVFAEAEALSLQRNASLGATRVASVRGGHVGSASGMLGDGGAGEVVVPGKSMSPECFAAERGRAKSRFVVSARSVFSHLGLRGGAGIPDWVAGMYACSWVYMYM